MVHVRLFLSSYGVASRNKLQPFKYANPDALEFSLKSCCYTSGILRAGIFRAPLYWKIILYSLACAEKFNRIVLIQF